MADTDGVSAPDRNEGEERLTPRMQYIENTDLRTQVVHELRRAVFKKGHTLASLTGCEVFVKVIDETSIPQFYGTEYFMRQYYEEGIKADEDDLAVSGATGLPIETSEQEEALDLSCKRDDSGATRKNLHHFLEELYDLNKSGSYNELQRHGTNFNPIHIEPEPPPASQQAQQSPRHAIAKSRTTALRNSAHDFSSNGKDRDGGCVSRSNNSGYETASVPSSQGHLKRSYHSMSEDMEESFGDAPPYSHPQNNSEGTRAHQTSNSAGLQHRENLTNGPVALTTEPQIHIERNGSPAPGGSHEQSTSSGGEPNQTNHIQEIKSYLIPLANVAVSLLLQRAQAQNNRQPIDKDALIAQAHALQMSNSGNGPQSAQAEELAKQAFAAALDLTVKSQEENTTPVTTVSRIHIEQPSSGETSTGKVLQNCQTVSVKDLLMHEAKKQKVSHGTQPNENVHSPGGYNPQVRHPSPGEVPTGPMQMTPQNTRIGPVPPLHPHMLNRPMMLQGLPPGQFSPTGLPPHHFRQLSPSSPNFQPLSPAQMGLDRPFMFQPHQQMPLALHPPQHQQQHQQTSTHTVRELLAQNARHPPNMRPRLSRHHSMPMSMPPPLIKKEPRERLKERPMPPKERTENPDAQESVRSSSSTADQAEKASPQQAAESQANQNNEVISDEKSPNQSESPPPREPLPSVKQEPVDPDEQEACQESDQASKTTQDSGDMDDDDSDSRLYIDTCENSPTDNGDQDDASSKDDDKSSQPDGKDSSDSNQGKDIAEDPKKRRFKCEICGKVYAKNESLKYHKMNHNNYRPHQCETCGRAFANPYTLDVHRRIHLNESDKPYKCKYCDKTFATSSHRNVHMTHHKEVKSFECSICRRRYLTRETLESHMQRHGERRYPCETCGMSFKAMAELTEHRTVHSLPKQLQCEVCSQEFTRRNLLLQHMTTVHPNAKPFECENCDKTFATLDSLRVHQRCHTGELPHKCRFCSRQFVHGKHREVHEMSHFKDNNKPPNMPMLVNTEGKLFYQCEKCGQVFTELSHLQTHQRLHKLQEKEEALATQAGMPLPSNILTSSGDLPVGASVITVPVTPPNSLGLQSPVANGPQIASVMSLQHMASSPPAVASLPQSMHMLPMSRAAPMANLQSPSAYDKRPLALSPGSGLVPQHSTAGYTSAPTAPPSEENAHQNFEKVGALNLSSPPARQSSPQHQSPRQPSASPSRQDSGGNSEATREQPSVAT
ncbi:uncharacterized protein [Ptychodera flava]|uniref:uncharacterized protein n=1 Tax=Ptychodera flava TaxID=63121 RepID=UPI00396A05C2